jgi:subtilase family protein
VVRKLIGLAAAVGGCAALCSPASAFTAPEYAVRPMKLPTTAGARAAAAAEPGRWLVGAKPGANVAKVAKRFGARPLRLDGAFSVSRDRARALAAALRSRHDLVYAEPDVILRRHSAPDATPGAWARGSVVAPTTVPPAPAVTVGIVDDFVDTTLPDLAGQTTIVNGPPTLTGSHGTEVASAVSAAANGSGVVGIFPSVPLVSFGLPANISCSAAANGIVGVVNAKANIVNLSFGSPSQCFTLFRTVEAAYGAGTLVVAAAGNEAQQGNAPNYPAAWPHVLSVAALAQSLAPASFSNSNAAVDLSAPGENVPLDTPLALDTDGVPDGTRLDTGTSFASPIVAGAAAWIWSARRSLTNGQVADVLRESAQDVNTPGYDTQTGYGLVNIANALAAPTPVNDPLEPNDDVTFIDGTSFRDPDPYIWRGFPRRPLRASVDVVEDPVDTYRVRVPARRTARVVLRTTFGDADLFAYPGTRKTLAGRPLARSEKNGRATDALTLRNPSGAPRRFYIAIVSASRSSLNSSYGLSFSLGR